MTVGNHDNTVIDEFESQPAIDEIILHERYSSTCSSLLRLPKFRNFSHHQRVKLQTATVILPGTTHDYDIAVIKLSEDIEFNNHVQPACLPSNDTVYEPGKRCFISGWGRTRDGENQAFFFLAPTARATACIFSLLGKLLTPILFADMNVDGVSRAHPSVLPSPVILVRFS